MHWSESDDECCIVYENVRNAVQIFHEQHGNNLKSSGSRKSELSIISESGKISRSISTSLMQKPCVQPGKHIIQNAKKSDSKQNTKSAAVQTVESAHSFVHGSGKSCKTSASVKIGESDTVVHTVNSAEAQTPNSIGFSGLQKSGYVDPHDAENLTPDVSVEKERQYVMEIKPRTYEEAMQTIKAFENEAESLCDDLDMEEITLDFEPPYLHKLGLTKLSGLSENDRKNLISQGGHIRCGRWSKCEEKILIRNWNNFVREYKIDNPTLLLGLYRGRRRRRKIDTFCRAKKFHLQLGRDLNYRTLMSIRRRARNLLDKWNYKGKFSAEEYEELFRLQHLMGNKWSKIAILMKRQGMMCSKVYRSNINKPMKGCWSEKEDQLLMKAVRRCVGGKKLRTTFRGYPWAKIARLIQNRNELQCRARWLTSLCWKYNRKDRRKWKERNDALLIYLMYVDMVEDQCFVDWDYLYKIFSDSAPSHVLLQVRWTELKRKVPNFVDKDHESIVLYLYQNYLPKILQNLNMTEHDLKSMRKQKVNT